MPLLGEDGAHQTAAGALCAGSPVQLVDARRAFPTASDVWRAEALVERAKTEWDRMATRVMVVESENRRLIKLGRHQVERAHGDRRRIEDLTRALEVATGKRGGQAVAALLFVQGVLVRLSKEGGSCPSCLLRKAAGHRPKCRIIGAIGRISDVVGRNALRSRSRLLQKGGRHAQA
jgi:hypothetical protein